MCGRFTLHHTTQETIERFSVDQSTIDLEPRYNIAPSQPVAVVLQRQQRTLEAFKWGLVPFWAKDPKIGNRMINARSETLAEKPAYKTPLKRRRCLIPTSGFYEWKKQADERIPTYIYLRDTRLFALAGLWEEWSAPDGETLYSCTIITTQANQFMSQIHHRMPIIFNPVQEEIWLDPAVQDPAELLPLLQPYAEEKMAAHPVSRQMNVPTFDEPACIEALAEN
jgi:putative SOS response-associated peptidase YedK